MVSKKMRISPTLLGNESFTHQLRALNSSKVRVVPLLLKTTLFGQCGGSSLTNKRARTTIFGQ